MQGSVTTGIQRRILARALRSSHPFVMEQLMVTVPVMGAAVAFALWNWRRSQTAMANMGPLFETFFQQTGYRNPRMPTAPLAVQAAAAAQQYQAMYAQGTGNSSISYVRDMNGLLIEHHATMARSETGYSISAGWEMRLPRPPRCGWHVAEKRFGSVGLAIKEAFSNMETKWSPAYSVQAVSGDPAFDARFQCFAEHPDVLRYVVANQGLKQMMLDCAEVDLRVLHDRVTFSDPLQRNLQAGMGGGMGAMMAGYDYNTLMQATIPVHLRICDLLYLAGTMSL